MFRIDEYIDKLVITLKDVFGERLLYNEICHRYSISLKDDMDYDFDSAFSAVFGWCQNALAKI